MGPKEVHQLLFQSYITASVTKVIMKYNNSKDVGTHTSTFLSICFALRSISAYSAASFNCFCMLELSTSRNWVSVRCLCSVKKRNITYLKELVSDVKKIYKKNHTLTRYENYDNLPTFQKKKKKPSLKGDNFDKIKASHRWMYHER